MSIVEKDNEMSLTDQEKKRLLDEHVRLTAQFISGNPAAADRLAEIEKELDMTPDEIARRAAQDYSRNY